jgi:hypothetical protein
MASPEALPGAQEEAEIGMASPELYSGKRALVGPDRPGMIWHGYTGMLIPVFKFYALRSHIRHGDQGTR